MMRTMIGAVLAAGVVALGATVSADDPPAGGPTGPLPQHKLLAKEVGVWDADVTITPPGADAPIKSKAVETNRMLGDRWLISDFKGEFGGMPFEGHGQNGYDAKKGKYIGTWIDSMSHRIDSLEGTYDEKAKTLTFHAEMEDPTGKPMKARFATEFKGDDERIFKEYVKADGASDYALMMTIHYKKRAK